MLGAIPNANLKKLPGDCNGTESCNLELSYSLYTKACTGLYSRHRALYDRPVLKCSPSSFRVSGQMQ